MKILSNIIIACACIALPVRTYAQSTPVPRTYWLVVTGLSGEEEFAAKYREWGLKVTKAARERFSATQVTWLGEKEDPAVGITGTSTRANIEARLREIANAATADDAVFIILIGHGSFADNTARIALPGPDVTPADLALWLTPVAARTTIVNTISSSGAWLAPLAAKRRVVITSTKSGTEQNHATFGAYFADALSLDDADTDKDNRVSVLEAYTYAKREVERAYAADKRMLTEHAQIDGDGDGKAVAVAAVESPDGAIASLTHFGLLGGTAAANGAATPQSPALQALYATKAKLELQLADLRGRKATMADAEYQKELEALLLEIARNGQEIRKLEGGK